MTSENTSRTTPFYKKKLISIRNFIKKPMGTVILLASVLTLIFISLLAIFSWFESPSKAHLRQEIVLYKEQLEQINDRISFIEKIAKNLEERDNDIYRIIFESEPIPSKIRSGAFGGSNRYSKYIGFNSSELIASTNTKLDKLSHQLYIQSKSFDDVYEMALAKEDMLASLPAIQPVNSSLIRRISSYFGYRTDPFYKVQKFHHGIDFSAPKGTPVYATGNGKVKKIIRSDRGYGNQIVIDHGYSFQTLYAHMDSFCVKIGERVKRGHLIGYIGNSGRSTAPHLHYEVIRNNEKVNPLYFFYNDITPQQFEEMLEESEIPSQSMD